MELLTREGIPFIFRWLHVIAGITWIGLLYYFNFVQVPAFAAYGDEARARSVSINVLARKALWWFRWAAVGTVVMGLLIAFSTEEYFTDFGKRTYGISISTGMLLGLIMFVNVWAIIWRNQKIVLANAAKVLDGGEADPAAPAAARRGAMASRQNVVFSVAMVWFMLFTSHFSIAYGDAGTAEGGKLALYWIVSLAVIAVMELSALGIIGGTTVGHVTNWMYESVQNALISAFALWAFFWIWWEIVF